MNSFRLGVFDIFAYIIPGIVYIVLISLSINLITFEELINKTESLSIYSMLAYFFVAYLIGFALENIAAKYCSIINDLLKGKLKNRIIEKFNKNNPDAEIDDYNFDFLYAFTDIYSSVSRDKSDNFSALAKMSRNLSLVFFLFMIFTLLFNLINFSQIDWFVLPLKFIIGITISVIFLYHADRYQRYSLEHLLNTYYIISKNIDKIESSKKPKDRKS